jgi:uncharacterized protein
MSGWSFVFVVAIALVGYLTLIAQRSSPSHRQLPPIIPAQAGLKSEVVRFRARDEVLTIGAWYMPAPGAAQAVIIAYDSRECRNLEFVTNALDLAAHLHQYGLTVLILDMRDPSERGATRIAYGSRERRDLLGAVDWLLAHGYVPGTIGVLGVSIGAVAGIDAANREQAIGALIVARACAAVLPKMRMRLRRFSTLLPYVLPDRRLLTGNYPGHQRLAELLDVIDRRPVLIMHAKGDQFVPAEHARALVRADDAELWVADCVTQLDDLGTNSPACHQHVTRFFCCALAGRHTPHVGDASTGDADRNTRSATDTPHRRLPPNCKDSVNRHYRTAMVSHKGACIDEFHHRKIDCRAGSRFY